MNNFNKILYLVVLTLILARVDAQTEHLSVFNQKMSFDAYLSTVGKQNLEYLANKLNVDIADAEVLAAKVLPDPSLDFEAAKETFSLGLSYSLELGKRHARTNLAKSERDVEMLTLEQQFHDLRAQAADLFLDAILQKELLSVKKTSYQYMLQLSQSDSLRLIAGELNENDARQSRLEAISLLNEVYDQEAAYYSSLVELNKFMGTNTDTLFIPEGNWQKLECEYTLPSLLNIGITNRADLLAATKSIEVNTNAYKLARAERRPDIDLSLSYERDWNRFLPEARYVTMGVSIPLTFSVMNKGSVRAAKHRTNQSVLLQKDAELQVQSEIKQSWLAFEAEKKKVSQYQLGVLNESQKVLDGMVYKYRRGEATILDVLIAQRTYNDISQDYLETMKGYVSALVALEKSCGIWDIHF